MTDKNQDIARQGSFSRWLSENQTAMLFDEAYTRWSVATGIGSATDKLRPLYKNSEACRLWKTVPRSHPTSNAIEDFDFARTLWPEPTDRKGAILRLVDEFEWHWQRARAAVTALRCWRKGGEHPTTAMNAHFQRINAEFIQLTMRPATTEISGMKPPFTIPESQPVVDPFVRHYKDTLRGVRVDDGRWFLIYADRELNVSEDFARTAAPWVGLSVVLTSAFTDIRLDVPDTPI